MAWKQSTLVVIRDHRPLTELKREAQKPLKKIMRHVPRL
jgi:hypothetical protein